MSAGDGDRAGCGCCAGLGGGTPVCLKNRPGLSAIAWRVGTQPRFKQAMLAEISTKQKLVDLTTRDDDDPTIALLDAWATALDVLTFYQERIANEGFLRTATERRSILELARAIGYELGPGVAASTWLAFTLDGSPGSPREVVIPAGTRAQSLPVKSELPQSFETAEPLVARPEWNTLRPRQTEPQSFVQGKTKELLIDGVATRLQPGDAILLVGEERKDHPESESWDFRILLEVEPQPERGVTRVSWEQPLGHDKPLSPPANAPKLFAFRQRAGLLRNPSTGRPIDLDAVYPRIITGSWVVLRSASYTELYNVKSVNTHSLTTQMRSELTVKATNLMLDTEENLLRFDCSETVVFAQSEELKLAERVTDPVEGSQIKLDGLVGGLVRGRAVIVQGKRMRAEVKGGPLTLTAKDGSTDEFGPGETLQVLARRTERYSTSTTWRLLDRDGVERFITIYQLQASFSAHGMGSAAVPVVRADLSFVPAEENDPEVAEMASLEDPASDRTRTILQLTESLSNLYDPATVSIFANVAQATHGETKREVLGGGDASKRFQRFRLRQQPLTYTKAAVPGGGESTLELRVNGVRWHESPDLYRLGPRDRKYVLRRDGEGNTTVRFGDGVHGARLPSGVENVEAVYRAGLGLAGNVEENRISLLANRPLGVKSVINPVPATGGDEPEARDQARRNAPTTVLTLDRVVSLRDFEDFARSFAAIDKAQARMLWSGGRRIVHLTVAGVGGLAVDSTLAQSLHEALDRLRDPFQELKVESYEPVHFHVSLKVKVDPDYVSETVCAHVEDALRKTFSFAARDFGQSVSLSEVMAVAQRVEGVIYVDVDWLYFDKQAVTLQEDPLFALPARVDDAGAIHTAQILTLSPLPVQPKALS